MKLWTQTSGSGDELLLIHGWGMNAAVWQTLATELEKEYRVTQVELPGHGASPWNGLTSLESWAEQVLEVAPADAIWLGWSLGGLVMQQAAQMQPQKLRALVGVATSPCFVQRDDWPCAMPAAVLENFAVELTVNMRKTLRRFLALQVQGEADARRLLPQLRTALEDRATAKPDALRAGLMMLLHSDFCKQLSKLEQPLCWILGERDTLVPRHLATALPGYQSEAQLHVIRGAAHAPFLSHQPQVLEVLKGFVRHV
ncbi:pimeloyl-ACP methyl ester esterase BioH [Thiolapillus sp.]